MELIANLRLSFAPPGRPQAPANLLEMAALLGQVHPGPEVAEYSLLWASELERIHRADHERLAKKRGRLRRLWAEQRLIYLDLVATLQEAAANIQNRRPLQDSHRQFQELLEEFAQSLQEMETWSTSAQPRCLACGWDGNDRFCPHCDLRLLTPVRQSRPSAAPLQLAPHHQAIFDTVVAVLDGHQDLDSLQEPLEELQSDFYTAVCDAEASAEVHPEMEAVTEILELALEGLTEMTLVFEDQDCQHLEDGWNAFYLSQLTLLDTLSPPATDQVSFTRD